MTEQITTVEGLLAELRALPTTFACFDGIEDSDHDDAIRAEQMYAILDRFRPDRPAPMVAVVGCGCSCHTMPGMYHVAACCDAPPFRFDRPVGVSEEDEHHTMDELYDYRMAYHAHAARGWLATGVPVVKSRKHSDGEPCFDGDWFIVVATLPAGQVSNHYRNEHWDLFDVPEVDLPPEYDGHTPALALERLLVPMSTRPPAVVDAGQVAELLRLFGHFECDCVPDLGPSHCHGCSFTFDRQEVPWTERNCLDVVIYEQGNDEGLTVTGETK